MITNNYHPTATASQAQNTEGAQYSQAHHQSINANITLYRQMMDSRSDDFMSPSPSLTKGTGLPITITSPSMNFTTGVDVATKCCCTESSCSKLYPDSFGNGTLYAEGGPSFDKTTIVPGDEMWANHEGNVSADKIKSRWTRSFFTAVDRRSDEEKYSCDICHKVLAGPSTLNLHRSTHVIERPYKCEPCQVSFNTQGHLQKHKRSHAHETRVAMTREFGIPNTDNPRPYRCHECHIAFRKHGHLSKHLRSKSHIMKIESIGLVPVGTYALLEKSGPEVRDSIITTNCEQSLLSLKQICSSLLNNANAQTQSG